MVTTMTKKSIMATGDEQRGAHWNNLLL